MNYLEFLKCTAKDTHLNNCSKQPHYTQKYLANSYIGYLSYYSLKILPGKPLSCSSCSFA